MPAGKGIEIGFLQAGNKVALIFPRAAGRIDKSIDIAKPGKGFDLGQCATWAMHNRCRSSLRGRSWPTSFRVMEMDRRCPRGFRKNNARYRQIIQEGRDQLLPVGRWFESGPGPHFPTFRGRHFPPGLPRGLYRAAFASATPYGQNVGST